MSVSATVRMLVFLALCILAGEASAARLPKFRVTDLGSLNGSGGARAEAISGILHSRIAGSAPSAEGPYHAFAYAGGAMTDLGALVAGGDSYANGINAAGVACGYARAADQSLHAILYRDGGLVDLSALYGLMANAVPEAINRAGHLIIIDGDSTYLYAKEKMHRLYGGTGRGLDDFDRVAGTENRVAILYDHGTITPLGTLGGSASDAFATANTAMPMVTGQAYLPTDELSHAFIWKPSSGMTDLGTLGGSISQGLAINRMGAVVGWSTVGPFNNHTHAFLAIDGRMLDLNDLLDVSTGTGWLLQRAAGIDDVGRIVGSGTHDGIDSAFELTLLRP